MKDLAKWIFGMVDMSVASELPEKEQLEYLEFDLKLIKETSLYYYLVSAYENMNKTSKVANAKVLKESIQREVKVAKFEKMINMQQKLIESNMKAGMDSVVWIFQDEKYYNNDLEKTWFNEFELKAKDIFEKADYRIIGCVIKW